MSYNLDLSPAQAPLNCFGSGIVSGGNLSSKILSRLRPRHFRKTEYDDHLRDGDALMTEAWELFQACQHSLGYETRSNVQRGLDGLRVERDKLLKFADYGGSQQAEVDAVSRADTFRVNASRVRAMVAQARKNAYASPKSHHSRGSSPRAYFPEGNHNGSARTSRETGRGSATRTHASLSRVPALTEEPLEMLQTRAGPIGWTPSPQAPGPNALHLDVGSPLPLRPSATVSMRSSENSMLSLNIGLRQLSPGPMHMSPVSNDGSSPTDSVGMYSLASDGFPRPSRRVAGRRSIQSTTSLSKSTSSRQSSGQSSHPSRSSTNSSQPRQSTDSGSRSGSYHSQTHSPASRDGQRQNSHPKTPTSLRTSSVPPAYTSSPSGGSNTARY